MKHNRDIQNYGDVSSRRLNTQKGGSINVSGRRNSILVIGREICHRTWRETDE